MLGFLNRLVGTTLALIGVAILLIWLANDGFRERFREEIDVFLGREEISAQATVNLSESTVGVWMRSYTLGGLVSSTDFLGTGVIISENTPWTVITASHVALEEASGLLSGREILVGRPGETLGRADVVAREAGRDIAELRVTFLDRTRVPPVTVPSLAPAPDLGDAVATRCHDDTVIRTGKVVEFVERASGSTAFFMSIRAEPGCSGSPVVNAGGDLVGILIQGSGEVSLAVAVIPGVLQR